MEATRNMYTHKILYDGECVSLGETEEQAYRIKDLYQSAFPKGSMQVRKRGGYGNKNTKA